MSIRVKICGITTLDDALNAIRAGAWALGFNFYGKSPRYIDPAAAGKIIDDLPEGVVTVGVFVNEAPETIVGIREQCGLDYIQFSGDETPDVRRHVGGRIIQALRPASVKDLPPAAALNDVEILLLDAPKDARGLYGGSGNPAHGEYVEALKALGYPVLLAGGVTPENAKEYMERWRPDGLDIASGVESAPGIKDAEKMRVLFENLNIG